MLLLSIQNLTLKNSNKLETTKKTSVIILFKDFFNKCNAYSNNKKLND